MTIEQKINRYLEDKYGEQGYTSVEEWGKDVLNYPSDVITSIINMIREADITECLTSKSEFIREHKKLYEE